MLNWDSHTETELRFQISFIKRASSCSSLPPSKEVSALFVIIFFHTCYFPSRDSSFVLLFRTSIWTRCVFCKRCSILTSFRSEPGKEGRNPWSPLHVPCQGPGRAVLYRLWNYDSASPKEPFKTRDIIWISGWRSKKPIYFCGLFRQSMLSRIPYNFAVVGKYFFVDALNGKLSLHIHCYSTEYNSRHKLQLFRL